MLMDLHVYELMVNYLNIVDVHLPQSDSTTFYQNYVMEQDSL